MLERNLNSEVPGFPNSKYVWQTHAGLNLASHKEFGTFYYIRAGTEKKRHQITFWSQQ